MIESTAKVIRLTASGQLGAAGVKYNISAVQVLGGTADTKLYEDTSATAATLKLAVTAPGLVILEAPLQMDQVYVSAGLAATDILIHVV